jgi:hypothetical protein
MRNVMTQTEIDSLRALYMEVVALFRECGGAYRNTPDSTYLNIADALRNNRYVIHRDNGKMVRALLYWMIPAEDVDSVKHGRPPTEKNSGTVGYICEHAGTDGMKGVIRAVRELKDRYGGASVCWHDRYVSPETFRYFRRTPHE